MKMTQVLKHLRKERDVVQRQLSGLNAAISAFAGVYTGGKPTGKRRTLSVEARERISAAQRKRWAQTKKAAKKAAKPTS
jgi:hypothetical protein